MSALKVCHLTWRLDGGGGGIPPVVYGLAEAQARAGLRTRALGLEPRRRFARGPGGYEVQAFPALGPMALGYCPALSGVLESWHPDVVQLHGLFTGASLAALGYLARNRRPLVVSPHGMLDPWALTRSPLKKGLFRLLIEEGTLRGAGCLHALVEDEARQMRALGLRTPIAVVPNGVDPDAYDALPPRAELEALIPAARGRRVLLFLSRVHPKKGLLPLVEAWAALEREGRLAGGDWLLLVAGPEQLGHQGEVQARAEALGVGRRVAFAGPLYGEAKRAALGGAEALVLPSYSEGLPMAVLEAMAARLPVLITRACNLPAVARARAGWIGEPDPLALAAPLRELVEAPPAALREMGERGRRLVVESYSWRHAAGQLTEVYRWLTGGPRPGFVQGQVRGPGAA